MKLGLISILHASDPSYAEAIQRFLDETGSDFSDQMISDFSGEDECYEQLQGSTNIFTIIKK